VNPRPEIVLPPGFALRIDYDPESSPASLLITAYRDDAPVGQAHVDPRDVGHRLRLDVDAGDVATATTDEPRLRLTPQRAMRAIVMRAVHEPAPPREVPPPVQVPPMHPAMAALHELARDGVLADAGDYDTESPRATNALVWLDNGSAVVLPDDALQAERAWTRMQRTLRALSVAAVDLLGNPLRLREADGESWPSWRASWRGVHQPSGASEG
jgi:hypothetical protein